MTAIGICVEWIASFIEVTLCNYFMYNLAEVQFTRKKQRGMFFAVTAVITTGIILLNLVELSYSMATLFYGIVALALGGCILYRGSFVDFLFITITFVTGLVLIEGAIFNAIAWIWSPEVVLRIQEGFSLLRICIS